MSRRAFRALWVAGCAVFLAALVYAYHRYVWTHPSSTITYVRDGIVYELLNPRMLGVALIAPWFVGVLAWTLADLPWQQKLLAVVMRIGFVALLALALARPVQSADTDKICLLYTSPSPRDLSTSRMPSSA